MQKKGSFYIQHCLTLCLLALWSFNAIGQTYNNEWIDFSKTYYKFKVIKNGLYRIPVSTLATAGLDGTSAENFALFRNGQEVPLYTSSPSGALPANGYIEFYGNINDGVPDKQLYLNPAYQHTTAVSLFSDTATYFLVSRPGTSNLRFATQTMGDVNNPQIPAEPYFMYTAANYYKTKINPGLYNDVGEFVYSSSFDKGEFFSSADIANQQTLGAVNLSNLSLYTGSGAPDASLKFGAFGNNMLNSRRLDAMVNGNVVGSVQLNNLSDAIQTVSVPLSNINTSNTPVAFYNSSTTANDRVVVSFFELTYPRQFNFGSATDFFPFTLSANSQGQYLQITVATGFITGNVAPVLYDLTNNRRYVGVVSSTTTVKFLLPPTSTQTTYVLGSQVNGRPVTISSLTAKNFVDYSKQQNQGDFLIITNPILYNGTNGNNPIQAYRDYRSSSNGGSFNAKVMEIGELTDQFGFGILYHPSAVKNFIAYARNKFAITPKNVLLIGKGVNYSDAYSNRNNTSLSLLNLVPTFGWPASDNLLSANGVSSPVATIPIGRLSVVSGSEVEDYLQKLGEYETAQRTAQNTIADRLWMKSVLELTGADEDYIGPLLCQYVGIYKDILEDTLTGTKVTVFCKTSVNNAGQDVSQTISNLFSDGLSLLTYFGHSAATVLDFNLDDPQNYNNQGKYPVFSVSGCNAGNDFSFTPSRLTAKETISEKFTLAKQRGSIAFVASTHFGIVQYLHPYLLSFNQDIATNYYTKTLGQINKDALAQLYNASPSDFYRRMNAEQILIHGDPAITFNFQAKPDYVIEDPQVLITPSFISLAEGNCKAFIRLYNLGKAVKDSIVLDVKRQHPDGSVSVLYRKKMRGIYYSDSVTIPIPIIATKDKGLNKLIITIDADNAVDEMSETNNSLTKEFFIYEDEARPVYPYDYSIVNVQGQKLYASTSNPISTARDYVMEIDTTQLFNSAIKKQVKINSVGGELEFNPGVTYKDSTVYYWRVAVVPQQGEDYHWNNFSFIYLSQSTPGFNQSHYYQHLGSTLDNMTYSQPNNWKYSTVSNNVFIRQAMYPTSGTQDNQFCINVNEQLVAQSACVGHSLVINVLDTVFLTPWKNTDDNGNNLYIGGSGSANCGSMRQYNFEFSYMDAASRKKIMDFLDAIPNGYYVAVRSIDYDNNRSYSSTWRADTALYGHNNSLYHKLLQNGFLEIDSINQPRDWALFYKKNDKSFTPQYKFSQGLYDAISLNINVNTYSYWGTVESPSFGPAKSWTQAHWRGKNVETGISKDSVGLQIIGVDLSGQNETVLYNLTPNDKDFDISAINASQYPYLKLKMYTKDTAQLSPYQLSYWRLNCNPVPEGAVAPNIYFKFKDTLELGEKLPLSIAFKNISPYKFDSLLVKMTVTDKDNVTKTIPLPRTKPLISGDTVTLRYDVDTKDLSGSNTLYVNFNPDNDQLEQYLYNNFIYRNFYVKPDIINPMLDVTFDGVHILNEDIVSAKPHILIKLKDNAKYLLLNDTSLLRVRVKFPSPDGGITPGEVRTYKYDNDTVRFIPAQSASDNTASIEFTPSFENSYSSDGDNYELILTGKDKSGNTAGQVDYRIGFTVISKPMISNLLNYPNPFTTSTAFVFTITGSEIPQQFKIQILTVTGKVVREITKDELGSIHIGRNITDFKWDGTDQFGQRLANGVYIYRVVTTLNGKKMDKYKAKGDDTDKFFNSGYGKMYLMK